MNDKEKREIIIEALKDIIWWLSGFMAKKTIEDDSAHLSTRHIEALRLAIEDLKNLNKE